MDEFKLFQMINVITENHMGLLEDVFICVEYTREPNIKSQYSEESDGYQCVVLKFNSLDSLKEFIKSNDIQLVEDQE